MSYPIEFRRQLLKQRKAKKTAELYKISENSFAKEKIDEYYTK